MRKLLLTIISALAVGYAAADEGMWLPRQIGKRAAEMKAAGSRLTPEEIYSDEKASLKDAVVHFAGGCTGEVVSPEGLVFTNHHCGYKYIQSHSSLENDYLTDGFTAMSRAEELPNPGLYVKFLIRMEDVTDRVMRGVKEGMDEAKRTALIKKNTEAVKKAAVKGTHYTAEVKPLYYDNQYYMWVYETFTDVRLVVAPPSSIGKFGGDTDNWIWPRHTGDFTVFRIYAGKDNKPAPYSKDNVPYKPRKYFKISTNGVREGDFTMIYGYPGTTNEYLISDAVDFVQNFSDPAKVKLRTARLDVINRAMNADRLTRIMYSVKAANIANAWKKWQGEMAGLERLGTVEKKRAMEQRFTAFAEGKPQYERVVPRLKELYAELKDYALTRDYYNEAVMAIEAVKFYSSYKGRKTQSDRDKEAEAFYKDYIPEIDRTIAALMIENYMADMPEQFIPEGLNEEIEKAGGVKEYVGRIYDSSAITSKERFAALTADSAKAMENLSADPIATLYDRFASVYDNRVKNRYKALNDSITGLYSVYMRGLMEIIPQNELYPDANGTLRVAYGNVGGYEYADAVVHKPVTTIEGIMQKDNPEIYDYNVPQRMRDIYARRDFGRWATDGTVPVCFIAAVHTSGGNSGSPMLNADGELIGINFDRTWRSTMSDMEFDPELCRNISVDVRYVLFCIDKISGAGYLLSELGVE